MVDLKDALRRSENRNFPGLDYINMELLKYASGKRKKSYSSQCMEYK
jgi:hypothetical protein